MLSRKLIGTTSAPGTNEVEKGAIRRFAEAIGDRNPIYHSESAARRAGYDGLVAPPTFVATFDAGSNLREAIGLGRRSVLLSEQSYHHLRPIVAGDVITVVQRVAEVKEREAVTGSMEFLVIEEEGRDAGGAVVYQGRCQLVVRGH